MAKAAAPKPAVKKAAAAKKNSASAKGADTPAALGFRMPAEWEPQEAIWLSWPHNYASWPGKFRPVPYNFANIVSVLSRFQTVRINAAKKLHSRARRLG